MARKKKKRLTPVEHILFPGGVGYPHVGGVKPTRRVKEAARSTARASTPGGRLEGPQRRASRILGFDVTTGHVKTKTRKAALEVEGIRSHRKRRRKPRHV